ncbi:MAG: anti-sigma factor family protein [Gemmatimonadales bacterium]
MANSARPHVPEEELHAYSDGELSPPQRIEIAEHLLGCLICRSHFAEVGEVRARASALLAIAAPIRIRAPALATAVANGQARRRLPRAMMAAAVAVVGFGVVFSLQPDQGAVPGVQLATTLVTPNVFGILGIGDSDAGSVRQHELQMAARLPTIPRLLPTRAAIPAPRLMSAPVEVDPVVTNDWAQSNWNEAVTFGNGSLARVAGLAVTSVRMHASISGGRPTFMIRQQLPDGRPVWVFEGPVDDITPVNQMLQASGIAMSMPSRTHPDYVGTDGHLTRTVRMVTVVGHLPVDSLNALGAMVKLR